MPIHLWEKDVIKRLPKGVTEIEKIILAQLIDSTDVSTPLESEE